MGLFPINCPKCGKNHLWFSGILDQRCAECQDRDSSSGIPIKTDENLTAHLQGWQCPICGSVYSPFISECPKCVNSLIKVTVSNTTGTKIIENDKK